METLLVPMQQCKYLNFWKVFQIIYWIIFFLLTINFSSDFDILFFVSSTLHIFFIVPNTL